MEDQAQAIRELREKLKMNRREFCRYFDIPYRTVCDWEAGKRRMPDYVLRLMTDKAESGSGEAGDPKEPDRDVLLEQLPDAADSEKRLNNTIFLLYLITEGYKKAHRLSTADFMDLNEEHDILGYIIDCPEVFDSLSEAGMVREVDNYVSRL